MWETAEGMPRWEKEERERCSRNQIRDSPTAQGVNHSGAEFSRRTAACDKGPAAVEEKHEVEGARETGAHEVEGARETTNCPPCFLHCLGMEESRAKEWSWPWEREEERCGLGVCLCFSPSEFILAHDINWKATSMPLSWPMSFLILFSPLVLL